MSHAGSWLGAVCFFQQTIWAPIGPVQKHLPDLHNPPYIREHLSDITLSSILVLYMHEPSPYEYVHAGEHGQFVSLNWCTHVPPGARHVHLLKQTKIFNFIHKFFKIRGCCLGAGMSTYLVSPCTIIQFYHLLGLHY